jgi:hypothetical protein
VVVRQERPHLHERCVDVGAPNDLGLTFASKLGEPINEAQAGRLGSQDSFASGSNPLLAC